MLFPPKAHDPSRSTQVRAGAFTLVEVTLALGIVVFAMTAMLGLLPVGLTTFQEAATLSVRSQVVQAVASEIARADSANVTARIYFFDNEGNALSAESDPRRVYTATVQVESLATLSPLGVSANSGRRVIISVERHQGKGTGTGAGSVIDYPLIIPNT